MGRGGDDQRHAVGAPPGKEAAAPAASDRAGADPPGEREPTYRIEELPPPTTTTAKGGGGVSARGEEGKRAFVVIINLPDLIDAKSRGLPGSEHSGGSGGNNTDGGRRGEQKAPSLSDVELDVLPTVLSLRVPGKYRLRLDMPCAVDEESVAARFNKSRAVLKVSVQEK